LNLILDILQILLNVIWWIIVIQFVLSILIAFNVINTYNDFVASLWNGLRTLTDPVYRPIRRIMPDTGGIDFSPMVVLIVIMIIERALIPALYRVAAGGAL
jgi:YggT family protein